MGIRTGKRSAGRRLKVKKDYSAKHLVNPFFHHRRQAPVRTAKNQIVNRRKRVYRRSWILLSVVIIVLGTLIWLLFFSNVFTIRKIEVEGLDRISQESVTTKAWEYINEHSNLVWLKRQELINQVNEEFNFQTLTIHKRWPDAVNLRANERQVAFVWVENDGQQYLADSQAHIISGYTLSDEEKKQKLNINNHGSQLVSEGQIKIDSEALSFILHLYDIIKDRYPIEDLWVDDEINKVVLKLQDFPQAYLNIKLTPEEQLENLLLAQSKAEESEAGSFIKLQYVDLRYGNLIYYK